MLSTLDVDALFPNSPSTTNYFFDLTARTSSNLFDHLEPAKGEGSIVLGGEVYCPQYHFVKEYERYEAPGSPTTPPSKSISKMRRQLSTTTTCSSGSSSRTLCDQCDSIAQLEVERFFSNVAAVSWSTLPSTKKVQQVDPTRRMSQQDPPPCNTFYLRSKCATGSRCRYGHDYELNSTQLEEIRRGAKWHPCSAVQHGLQCPEGDSCIYGHACPKGLFCRKPDCAFGADVNAEVVDLHGHRPITLRELIWQPSTEYYQVYPQLLSPVPISPYYEPCW
ncbi:hypothetical protein JCM5353_005645 [Sporobolomyces roseus]